MSQGVLILPHLDRPKVVGVHHRLLCLSGPLKGKAFYLNSPRIVIGRGDDCNIKISDPQLSRQHAEIVLVGEKYTITDLKSQNGVIVNGKKITQIALTPTDTIIFGQSVFKYNVVQVGEKDLEASTTPPEIERNQQNKKSKKEEEPTSKKSKNLYLIMALLLIGGILLMGEEDTVQKKKKVVKNEVTMDEFNDVIKKRQMSDDKELKDKLEAIFQRGLRELREGNYYRAMAEFNHALSLSPNNGRASFYLDKAKQSLDTEIEDHFIRGRRSYESLKFKQAIQSYCAIARLLQNDQEDERFKDAMANIKEVEVKIGLDEGEVNCL